MILDRPRSSERFPPSSGYSEYRDTGDSFRRGREGYERERNYGEGDGRGGNMGGGRGGGRGGGYRGSVRGAPRGSHRGGGRGGRGGGFDDRRGGYR